MLHTIVGTLLLVCVAILISGYISFLIYVGVKRGVVEGAEMLGDLWVKFQMEQEEKKNEDGTN